VNAAAAAAGDEIAFKVYALTDDARFYDNVSDRVRDIRFRFHGLRRQPRIRYDVTNGNPRWVLTLKRERPRRSTGTITVSFRCKYPTQTFSTNFVLTVLPPEGSRP
jgi:hypothetical protein